MDNKRIGCAKFVYPDKELLLKGLGRYLSSPKECENEYSALDRDVISERPRRLEDELTESQG